MIAIKNKTLSPKSIKPHFKNLKRHFLDLLKYSSLSLLEQPYSLTE